MSLLTSVFDVMKNITLNTLGVERDLTKLIADKDISKAMEMLENNDESVKLAMLEYNPDTHDVMNRPNKSRKKRNVYITQKLPRSWQRYINEVSLFFLLAKPIRFNLDNAEEGNTTKDNAFNEYKTFLKDVRFDSAMRKAKRLAGAETECAKMYYLYQDSAGKARAKIVILARQTGYYLRPLIDQYGRMVAFGYGYFVKEGDKTVEHFDIETSAYLYKCKKLNLGWEVIPEPNPVGKIRTIYYKQPKEWDGVEARIKRDEWLDSKAADVNEYFADPIAKGTTGALKNLMDPEQVGKVVLLGSKDDVFDYVNPPTAIELKKHEKEVLRESILQDSFTPDFSYENMKGMGTLSGEALKRALILGYMKRDNSKEIYDELLDREINLILAIMENVTHKGLKGIKDITISHEFAEPFDEDTKSRIDMIVNAYAGGVLSLDLAVSLMGLSKDNQKEVQRIIDDQKRKAEENSLPTGGL